MDPFTILTGLSAFAPIITKWMGASDNVQSIADKASTIASTLTGKSDPNEILDALRADDSKANEFALAILAQQDTFETIYAADKVNARARDIAISGTPAGNVRANHLATVAVVLIFAILLAVIWLPDLGEFAKGVITTILGVFLNQLTNIYAFEFGTTRRSREKADILQSQYVDSNNGKGT